MDLKLLGEGFLKLSEAEIAAAPKPTAPKPVALSTPEPVETPVPTTIYSLLDADVSAPVEIERKMPAWTRPESFPRSTVYRGMLEVVIDERGGVESVLLRRTVAPFYDQSLIAAAKHWRFRPAQKNGQAVKYRKVYEITLT